MNIKNKYLSSLGITQSSSYEDIRRILIKKNFVHNQLFVGTATFINNLKTGNYKPPTTSVAEEAEKIDTLLNTLYSQWFVGSDEGYRFFNDMIIARRKGIQIEQKGVYVRYHPNMTKREWMDRYDKAREIAETFKVFQDMYSEDLPQPKLRKQIGTKDIEQNIEIYLKVEAKISEYWHEQFESRYTDPATGKPMDKLPVMESVLEEVLDDEGIEDITKRKELREKYKNIYYDVAKRYMLPTYTELPKYLELVDAVLS